jgi:hypothetical protein
MRQGSKEIAESKNACTLFGNTSHKGRRKMMPKKTLLFAPCAINLAETSRMVEIADAFQTNFSARDAFENSFYPRRRRLRAAKQKAQLCMDAAGAASHKGKD